MSGFNKYILMQLLIGLILVAAVLTGIIWLMQSFKQIEMIVNRGISAATFMQLNLLLLPNFLTIVLPVALFIIVVFVYAKLISDRELVVMRASGLSQIGLCRPALILTFGVIAIGYALNLYFLPQSYRMFREMKWELLDSYTHVLLQEGAFNQVTRNITVYVRERSSDGQLHGILVHVGGDPEAPPVTYLAERGAIIKGENGSRFVMFNGNRQFVEKDSHQLSILYFDRSILEIEAGDKSADDRYREARERSVYELFHLEDDPGLDANDFGKFTIEGHKRVLSPVTSLAYTMIALAFLISGSFTRRTQSRRVLMASLTATLFLGAMMALENAAAKNLALIPMMYGLSVLPIIGGFYFVLRMPGARRSRTPQMVT